MVAAPPPLIFFTVDQFVPGIWPIFLEKADRAILPGSTVTSWYRNPAHNASVGGLVQSQHQLGTAFDVVPPDGRLQEQAAKLRAEGFIATVELRHVHAQAFEKGAAQRAGLLRAAGVPGAGVLIPT